jgi:protein-S-isoprenylcysteine O-methyltransferase Ste14
VMGAVVYVHSLRIFNPIYKKGQLATDGPYSIVRHPIYAAWILLIGPGIVLFFRSWPMLLVPLITYASFKTSIHKEDEYLEKKFGRIYTKYRLTVNELFPSPKFWKDLPAICLQICGNILSCRKS